MYEDPAKEGLVVTDTVTPIPVVLRPLPPPTTTRGGGRFRPKGSREGSQRAVW